jgi:hypothetical protein
LNGSMIFQRIMQKIKYTSEGKKVVVVGKLNKSQSIVSEVLVTEDGTELTSEENFAVDNLSLHDSPVKTWQQLECEKYAANLQNWKEKYDKELDKLRENVAKQREELNDLYSHLRGKTQYLRRVAPTIIKPELKRIIKDIDAFLCGKPMWAVYGDYGSYHIVPFNSQEIDDFFVSHRGDFPEEYRHVKILELFGTVNGSLLWRIKGSGSGSVIVRFFDSKESAVKYIEDEIARPDYKIWSNTLKLHDEHGVKIPIEKIRAYYAWQIRDVQQHLDDSNGYIEKDKAKIEALKSELAKFEIEQ